MKLERILVAVDFSEASERALDAAIAIARAGDAELHTVHALEMALPIFEPYAVSLPTEFLADARRVAQEKLDAATARAREAGLEGTAFVGEVPAASAVADRAAELDVDVLVVGTRGLTGMKHILLGSVAERTVHLVSCPVLTVKGDAPEFPPRAILVGVDFSDDSVAAVDTASLLAREFGATLHLVHAVDLRIPLVTPYEVAIPDTFVDSARAAAEKRLGEVAERVRASGVGTVELHLASAAPAYALADAAEDIGADLVVTGSRGLTGLKHVILGSVAERTLRHAACSVLTVKS